MEGTVHPGEIREVFLVEVGAELSQIVRVLEAKRTY